MVSCGVSLWLSVSKGWTRRAFQLDAKTFFTVFRSGVGYLYHDVLVVCPILSLHLRDPVGRSSGSREGQTQRLVARSPTLPGHVSRYT